MEKRRVIVNIYSNLNPLELRGFPQCISVHGIQRSIKSTLPARTTNEKNDSDWLCCVRYIFIQTKKISLQSGSSRSNEGYVVAYWKLLPAALSVSKLLSAQFARGKPIRNPPIKSISTELHNKNCIQFYITREKNSHTKCASRFLDCLQKINNFLHRRRIPIIETRPLLQIIKLRRNQLIILITFCQLD